MDLRKVQHDHGSEKEKYKLVTSSHSLLFLAKNILSESRILCHAASCKHFFTVDLEMHSYGSVIKIR